MKKIVELKVQIVFLSGTLPLYLEKALREEFLLKDLGVIRGSTTRANIVYSSRQYSSSREQEQFCEIKEYIEAHHSKFSSLEDKVLNLLPYCSQSGESKWIPRVPLLSRHLEQ